MSLPRLANRDARRLFLWRHALSGPQDKTPLDLIRRLGFVQVDSINTVERAHHMILAARRPTYRPKHLKRLLEKDRALFEHWTHDASIIPADFFAYWRLRFRRDAVKLRRNWQSWRPNGFEEKFEDVLAHVRDHGPVMTRDVAPDEARSNGGWWEWNPSKTALEYLWRTGNLAVCHRQGFQKAYDLTERVLPAAHALPEVDEPEIVDWACNAALDRIGFATSGEIAAFWDKIRPAEAKDWCQANLGRGLIEIEIECADGAPRKLYARADILDEVARAPEAPSGIRVLSPFDPALRDRKRAERLFGFAYRIEIFVPEPKRRYGYYVFPLLEGDRLVGRIDMKRDPDQGTLHVRAMWPEHRVSMGKGRVQRLESALARMARFAGCDGVSFEDGWLREPL